MARENAHGQLVGDDLGEWIEPPFPDPTPLTGRTVAVEPLSWDYHGAGLWLALAGAPEPIWTYMSFGPFEKVGELQSTVEALLGLPDWVPYAFVVDGEPLGFASYLRIQPTDGVIEVGSIVLSPQMQRTTAATEALYLMIRHVFDLGYRRCEWKCDDLNEPSRRAADRLGFAYEGTFRQATHYKGRNRDTAWYAITDREWPRLNRAFEHWLSPDNFGDDGRQLRTLQEVRDNT